MQWLLRHWEEAILVEGIHTWEPTYYFMDPLFIPMAMELDYKNLTEREKHFYAKWGSCGIGSPINQVDYIFVPINVNDNHWILMVFAVKKWAIMVLDPLNNEAEYPDKEEAMVSNPSLLL